MLIQIEGRPPRRTEPLSPETAPPVIGHRPDWLKVPLSHGPHFKGLKKLMREQNLHTICEEAVCPNIGECWGEFRTASFLLLGDTCTRNCGFCDVKTGRPGEVDWGEPMRLADAVARLELRHVVITSVTRDDLDDGQQIACAVLDFVRQDLLLPFGRFSLADVEYGSESAVFAFSVNWAEPDFDRNFGAIVPQSE